MNVNDEATETAWGGGCPPAAAQKVRLFVAVFPSGKVVEKLQKATADLKGKLDPRAVRWTSPEQMHLTMAFIGSVEHRRVADFGAVMESVAQESAGCLLESAGVGFFPNARRPRVLWAGLDGEVNRLLDLQKKLEQSLQNLGYVPEDRPFHPHLTLGRVKALSARECQMVLEFFDLFETARFGRWEVDKIELMQSVLSPHGAKYSVVKTCLLKKGEK